MSDHGLALPASRQLAIRQSELGTADYVVHLSADEVKALANAAGNPDRPLLAERNRLLVLTMFDGCLRVSEALAMVPRDIQDEAAGFAVIVPRGKASPTGGPRYGKVAISPTLAAQLRAYAYQMQLKPIERFFPITRPRAFQIITEAFARAGIRRPSKAVDHVGAIHVLRHSGAIERLRQTRNPKALQDQLRHRNFSTTMRYLKTLSQEESLAIQEGVDFRW